MPIQPIVAALAPAFVAFAIFAFVARLRAVPAWSHAVGGASVMLGAILGMIAVIGVPNFLPTEAAQWLIYAAIVLAAFAVFEHLWRNRRAPRIVARVVMLLLLISLILRPLLQHTWPASKSVLLLAAFTALIVALWESHDACARREAPAGFAVLLLLGLIAGSVLCLFSGSAKLAQLSGCVVSAFCGASIATWWNPQRYPISGLLAVAWPLSGLIWVQAFCYAEASVWPMLLLIAALVAPWLTRMSILRHRKPWQRLAAAAAVQAPLLTCAVFMAYRTYISSADEYGY